MTDTAGLPAVLGGNPVRQSGAFRTTPETGDLEVEYLSAWLRVAGDANAESRAYGVALQAGAVLDVELADLLGGEPAAFAAEFSALQVPARGAWCVPASNGTRIISTSLAALSCVAPSLGLRTPEVGGEVIVPALTFPATAAAVLRRNLVAVLVDVDPDTLCVDPAAVAAAISDRTVAVLPVHLYRSFADVVSIQRVCGKLGIATGEDCAHAHGARLRPNGSDARCAGTLGDFGTFSYQDSKVLTGSEGGAALTRHHELYEQIASAVTCGRKMRSSASLQAENERMSKVSAAYLRAQLRRFPEQSATRERTFAALSLVATELPGLAPLGQQRDVEVPPAYRWVFHVRLDEWGGMTLDQLALALSAELLCRVERIYQPLTESALYQPHSDAALEISDDFWRRIDPHRYHAPVATHAYETVLTIPHSAGLDPGLPDAFAAAVGKIHAHSARIARDVRV